MPILVATGQQIGAGWTPALSVVKALAALAAAKKLGGEAVYWLADEDHDRTEVASVVGLQGDRLIRHRFEFAAPDGTATGWLPWSDLHQDQAERLWGLCPPPREATLRGHVLALGSPLWDLGLRPFSPTRDVDRASLQPVLTNWRTLNLEGDLIRQADRLASEGAAVPLDPRSQAAWFSLDPTTGLRRRLEPSDPCPPGCWLSPGAALRPLFQGLVLKATHVVLGPAERAYWRLAEPLWERVGLPRPEILPRPTVHLLPEGLPLSPSDLEDVRLGRWEAFSSNRSPRPSDVAVPLPHPAWSEGLGQRHQQEWKRFRQRLTRLDRRLAREEATQRLGMDPERLRQGLFPFGRPQERVLPGLRWLQLPGFAENLLTTLLSREAAVHLIHVSGSWP